MPFLFGIVRGPFLIEYSGCKLDHLAGKCHEKAEDTWVDLIELQLDGIE